MKLLTKPVVIFLFGIVFANSICYGWLRMRVEDAVLVQRSELIVIGRLKAESIKYVPHIRNKNEGRSWEHHAILAIREVLKGKVEEKEIPIVIHYGLDPYIGGRCPKDGGKINIHVRQKDFPQDRIEILDTGNSAVSFTPLVEDAGKDNIWFLQRRSGRYGQISDSGQFGISDPEDLQPISMKEYFLAHLAKKSKRALNKLLKRESHHIKDIGTEQNYWEFLQVQCISDPNEKAVRLCRYLAPDKAPKNYRGEYNKSIRIHIRKLGSVVVNPLVDILASAKPEDKLDTVILALYDIGKPARSAVPHLVRMLEQKSNTTTYYVLSALQTIGDVAVAGSVRPFLADASLELRAQAAETLAWIGDKKSFDLIASAISEVIKDPNNLSVTDVCGYISDMCEALYRLDPTRARSIIKEVNAKYPSMNITRFISGYKDDG